MTNQNFYYRSFKESIKFIIFSVITAFLLASIFVISGFDKANASSAPVLISPSHGEVFDTPMPEISGTAQGADEVLIYIDNILNGKAKVVDGKFSYYPFLPLSSGNHKIVVQAQGVDFPVSIEIIPNPAPTFLAPEQGARAGQDRIWVGGVAKNDSLVRVLVNGQEMARTNVKNHASGAGSFSAELKDLPLGVHIITSIARDSRGKESFTSDVLIINIMPPTPAPILNKPIVNAYSGIERPFITGFAKNNLEISIVVNDKIVKKMPLGADPSGTISFSWQPSKAFSLGNHKIEAFASDDGKLSNNSKPVYWQVGEAAEAGKDPYEPETDQDPLSVSEPREQDILIVQDPKDSSPLAVQDDLDAQTQEEPVVPDEVEPDLLEDDIQGRIAADDDLILGAQDSLYDAQDQLGVTDAADDKIVEIAPGAVVRDVAGVDDEEFTFNTSLIIGIVILVFLLLSILVWYIQEKRAEIGDRVVNIFREDEEGNDFGMSRDNDFEYTSPEDKDVEPPEPPRPEPPSYEPPPRREGPEDLPPPPPPMF
ncbi:hypothetical protein KKF64_00990 [Patescibacteria group bacterium]|nr:hypothetical protein [Patescibacteria group bacterium]